MVLGAQASCLLVLGVNLFEKNAKLLESKIACGETMQAGMPALRTPLTFTNHGFLFGGMGTDPCDRK